MKDNCNIRIFVALFSYDPGTMSPNPGAAEEELAFTEGQIIQVRQQVIHKYKICVNQTLFSSLVNNHYIKVDAKTIFLLQVYGDKDADGFYQGECAGRVGLVPCNMVSEIQVEDEETQ